MQIEELYALFVKHPVVCTDTRKISKDCIFFALKGENFNGNSFASAALESGASYVVIDEEEYRKDERCILVDDVLTSLQQLATFHRQKLNIPVIGITGTNGKTTTKELIKAVLSEKFKTYATLGNLNNHIGVPLTLLSVREDTEIAIIEMGANHQKEIAFLCSIAKPTAGLITNVGKAHLEGFGGFEGVKKGKGELYDFMKVSGGKTFINRDNDFLVAMSEERGLTEPIYYGTKAECFVYGYLVENNPYLVVDWFAEGNKHCVKSNLTGIYNLENILAAAAIGLYYGLNAEQINRGIGGYVPSNNRSQITKTEINTLICDYYNANPSSMMVALDNFNAIDADQKVIILADMFELGNESAAEHRAILEKALKITADKKIFIGKEFCKLRDDKSYFFESTEEAFTYLKDHPVKDATVLIKGSRGMKLEKLVEVL
ncbi:UDP-N-acetylmuramoyl-tripeptide--D-alanyl-D-alanine ligase [Rubrolithibacter danxiaensis]|uniref:UDP-N-acetylmuramoyl-tripeptide--D-alanyl-D- alanine ligase n=1 Tax=Rubrolithibacter danxiaensis TaxID=3390805 RepID=UPI003BF90C81